MIPHTYPTFMDAQKKAYMKVFFLSSVSGLTKWIDYIPVKTVAFSSSNEGTTNTGGHMTVTQVASDTALAKWRDYIPVYEDAAATVAWSSNNNGYIPVCQLLNLEFLNTSVLDSRITFTRADAVTCATYFDSTGRLATAAANIPRFDYDPAVPAGVTGGELVTNGDFSQGLTNWVSFGTTGNVAVSNGQLRINAADGVNSGVTQITFLTVGKRYRLTFNLVSVTGAGIQVNDNVGPIYGTYTTAGTQTLDFTASTSSLQFKRAAGVVDATLDNISVQEVTFTPRGLLIEESRKNNLLHSRDMTQAAWSKTDVTPARTQVGIDGVANTACLMTEGSAGTALTSQNTATVTASNPLAGSIVLKRGNTDWVRLVVGTTAGDAAQTWVNLSTGALSNTAALGLATGASGSITSLGGGWYRVALSCTPNGVGTTGLFQFYSTTASGATTRVSGATYIVDAAQIEVGAFATSIIPCGATALTRAADVPVMTGTNFSSWYNQTQGSFVAEFRRFGFDNGAGSVGICQADDGTANNRVGLRLAGRIANIASQQIISVASVVNLNEALGPSTSIDGLNVKATIGYQVGVGATGRDGTVANATSNPSLPTVTQLNMGQGPGAVALNGWIRSLRYYPVRLPNATLQALTT